VDNTIQSVTVIAPSAAEADAFSTACFVMGLDKSKEFAHAFKSIGVYILYDGGEGKLSVFESAGWKKYGN
jgi:thiamine biosynthesis lipoprotein